jgi:hypothetical protein
MRRVGLSLLLLAGCSGAKVAAPSVPDAIKVPDGNVAVLKAAATGSQIYVCDGSAWTLKAPDAELHDAAGKKIGRHYAGPTWELDDGSKVVGALKAKVDAPDATAIPWLLVAAKTASGDGALGKVTFVQRVDTSGGKAPATGCDAAHKDAEQSVPYTANYYFFAAK